VFLLLSCTAGLGWKVSSILREQKSAAKKRLDQNGKKWGIQKGGLFEEPDEDEDEALWE
jgi:hypothetical protein